jgi:hypothetical protein
MASKAEGASLRIIHCDIFRGYDPPVPLTQALATFPWLVGTLKL